MCTQTAAYKVVGAERCEGAAQQSGHHSSRGSALAWPGRRNLHALNCTRVDGLAGPTVGCSGVGERPPSGQL